MSPETYVLVALIVVGVALVAGVFAVIFKADEPIDYTLLVPAVLLAPIVGLAWPLVAVVAVLAALAFGVRPRAVAMLERIKAWRGRRAETDADRYRRLARQERDSAFTHRATPGLAELHARTAAQYDQLAGLYDRQHRL